MKTDRIDTTQFHITSVQDDQSEIKLSSGSISVDLLHKREKSEDEGIISITLKLSMSRLPNNCYEEARLKWMSESLFKSI